MLTKCFVLWIGYFVTGSVANVASFIKPCKPLDSECIVKSATIALPYFAKGIPELGVPPLETIHIKDCNVESGELKISFRDFVVENLDKCTFVSITRDPVKSTTSLTVDCPLYIKGGYTMSGSLFFLPIEGDGPLEIEGGTMLITVDMKLKAYEKDGKKHYKLGSFDYKYEPKKKYNLKFENLFNGDRKKAEPIEKIIAESWKELILDIGQPLMKEGITAAANVIEKFFKAMPSEELEIV